MPKFIQTTTDGKTLVITLHRPKVLNALRIELLAELGEAVQRLYETEALAGAIITGAGEKAFAAGADISELTVLADAEAARALSKKGQDLFFKIEESPKPIIAAVNGFALGGGCELAMACHMRIAAPNARFGQPEVNLGLLAGYGGTQRLVQQIGRAKATELLLTGDMIDADTALTLGLVNHVVPQKELLGTCKKMLEKIYTKSPFAVALTLEAIHTGAKGEDGYAVEQENFGKAVNSHDGREGTQAFLEKRKPEFKGR